MLDETGSASGKSAKDSKRDSSAKKKSAKVRPVPASVEAPAEAAAPDLSRLVAGLAADIASLRAEMNNGKSAGKPKRTANIFEAPLSDGDTDVDAASLHQRAEKISTETGQPSAAVHLTVAHYPEAALSESANIPTALLRFSGAAASDPAGRIAVEGSRNERAARIAASLGAEPRVTIARLLLFEPTLTAAQLGTGAELTTGSLYHHLREMTHAGILDVVSRNRYTLTALGRRSLLALLALAEGNIAG